MTLVQAVEERDVRPASRHELCTLHIVPQLPRFLADHPQLDILWAVFSSGRLASAKARAFAEFVRAVLTNAA